MTDDAKLHIPATAPEHLCFRCPSHHVVLVRSVSSGRVVWWHKGSTRTSVSEAIELWGKLGGRDDAEYMELWRVEPDVATFVASTR